MTAAALACVQTALGDKAFHEALGDAVAYAEIQMRVPLAAIKETGRSSTGSYISLFLSWAPTSSGERERPPPQHAILHQSPRQHLVLGMEHHGIHHLHPAIPLTSNATVFREMKPILEARACRFEHL